MYVSERAYRRRSMWAHASRRSTSCSTMKTNEPAMKPYFTTANKTQLM